MTVALVLDFPGGTKQQYDEVVERMQLDGHMRPGGLVHVAGSYDGGRRVIDVWEDLSQFERFRDELIIPTTSAVGLAPPNVRVIEIDEDKGGSGEAPELVQCVILSGIDRDGFHAADDKIVVRDHFMESRVQPAIADAALQGPPQVEDLMVEATMHGHATASA